jgi:hypothetical protein
MKKTLLASVFAFALGVASILFLQDVFHSPVAPRTPYVPPQATILKGVTQEVVQTPLVVLKPTQKVQKKIKDKLGIQVQEGHLLDIREIKKLENGGSLVVTLEDVELNGEKSQKVKTEIVPNPPKSFEWMNDLSMSVLYGKGIVGAEDNTMVTTVWIARLEYDPFRYKKTTLHTEVGAIGIDGREFGYVAAGAKIRIH